MFVCPLKANLLPHGVTLFEKQKKTWSNLIHKTSHIPNEIDSWTHPNGKKRFIFNPTIIIQTYTHTHTLFEVIINEKFHLILSNIFLFFCIQKCKMKPIEFFFLTMSTFVLFVCLFGWMLLRVAIYFVR